MRSSRSPACRATAWRSGSSACDSCAVDVGARAHGRVLPLRRTQLRRPLHAGPARSRLVHPARQARYRAAHGLAGRGHHGPLGVRAAAPAVPVAAHRIPGAERAVRCAVAGARARRRRRAQHQAGRQRAGARATSASACGSSATSRRSGQRAGVRQRAGAAVQRFQDRATDWRRTASSARRSCATHQRAAGGAPAHAAGEHGAPALAAGDSSRRTCSW